MVRSERLGESPDRRENFLEGPWFPITLAMAGSLWQRGNASGGGNLVSQASHRGMAKRLASCQVLHLHHKLRVAPLSSVVREPCEFWLTTSLASSD